MLKHLRDNVYCRLAPSTVHSVGVFALRDIPQGTDPFQRFEPAVPVRADLSDLQMKRAGVSAEVVGLVHDFFLRNNDRRRSYPVCDPNQIDMSFYLNHGGPQHANMHFAKCTDHDQCAYDHLVASRYIRAGEELLLDYGANGQYVADKLN